MNEGNPLGTSPSLDNPPEGPKGGATKEEGSQPRKGAATEIKTTEFSLQELERGWFESHASSEAVEIQKARDAWLAEKQQVEKGLEQRRLRLEMQEQRLLARYNELIDRERLLPDHDEDAISERRLPPLTETEWGIRTESPKEEIEALQRRVHELEIRLELAISERDTSWDELRRLREDSKAPGKNPDNAAPTMLQAEARPPQESELAGLGAQPEEEMNRRNEAALESVKMRQELELERKRIQGEMHELRLLYAEINEMRDIAEREYSRKEAILSRERLQIARLREALRLDRDRFLAEIKHQNQAKD
jgi:hypothetical protein